jgi:hypothetical protein
MKIINTVLIFVFLLIGVNSALAQLNPPTLLLPPNGDTNVSVTPTFDWTDVSGATSYRIEVWTGLTLIIDVQGLMSSTYSVTSGQLSSNTNYYWRAAAVNSSQTSWSGYWNFKTTLAAPMPPVLIAPPNNATGVSRTPTLDWSDVSGANYYGVQVSTSPSFGTTVINANGLTSSQYVVTTPLNYGTVYYWRVNASNAGGPSSWSNAWSFTTIISPPAPPALTSPPNGGLNISVTPLMDWTDVSGVSYTLQISTDANFNTIILNAGSLTQSQYQIQPGTFSGSTLYYWRVASSNAGGQGNWSTIWSFTTIVGPPAAPALLSPYNNAINITRTPLIDWSTVSGAGSYRIQVSTDSTFNSTYIINTLTGTSEYQVTSALGYYTKYYWRVCAINNGGAGPYSTVWNFRTVPQAPSAPTLIAPLNGSSGISLTPTLDWSDVPTANDYIVQIALSSAFSNIIYSDTVSASQRIVPSGVLNGSIQYYWRVFARNAGGNSPSSSVWNFTTLVTLGANVKVYLEGFYTGGIQRQDTVRIYLANSTAPYLLRDSNISVISSNGMLTTSFTHAPIGSYYIVVKHRNHLETWSSQPQPFTMGTPVSYDFTTGANKAYGNNMKQVGNVWVLYGGDANQDGFVDMPDYLIFVSQFGKDGYKSPDFEGDNFVDGYDLPIFYSNLGKSKARP